MKTTIPKRSLSFISILFFSLSTCFHKLLILEKAILMLSKGINGGTVTPGDTLEVRASFIVRGTGFFDSCAFFDIVPTGTAFIPEAYVSAPTKEKSINSLLMHNLVPHLTMKDGSLALISASILDLIKPMQPSTVYRRGRIQKYS
jgi:hypothetical protein